MKYNKIMIIKFFSFSKRYFFAILALSLVFVGFSLVWTREEPFLPDSPGDVRSGYPFGYISTDYKSIYESGPYKFEPQYLDFATNGHRSTIIWPLLFLSIATMQLMFTMAFFAFFLVFFNA